MGRESNELSVISRKVNGRFRKHRWEKIGPSTRLGWSVSARQRETKGLPGAFAPALFIRPASRTAELARLADPELRLAALAGVPS